jgi:hypothetical protein
MELTLVPAFNPQDVELLFRKGPTNRACVKNTPITSIVIPEYHRDAEISMITVVESASKLGGIAIVHASTIPMDGRYADTKNAINDHIQDVVNQGFNRNDITFLTEQVTSTVQPIKSANSITVTTGTKRLMAMLQTMRNAMMDGIICMFDRNTLEPSGTWEKFSDQFNRCRIAPAHPMWPLMWSGKLDDRGAVIPGTSDDLVFALASAVHWIQFERSRM